MPHLVLASTADPINPWLGWGIIALSVGLMLIVVQTHRRSRHHLPDDSDVARLWEQHGFTFEPDASPVLRAAAARVRRGARTAAAAHVVGLPASSGIRLPAVRREADHEVWLGDVWDITSVTENNGKPVAASVELKMVAAIRLPVTCPALVIGQETALSQLLDAAGLRDIQLESDAFNRSWRVRADDERFAYAVVTPQLMAALEDAGANVALEIAGDLLTVHELKPKRGRSGGQAVALERLVDAIGRIAGTIRPHTWPSTGAAHRQDVAEGGVTVDPRPPGTPHVRPATRHVASGYLVGFGVPLTFIVVIGRALLCAS